MQCKYRDKLHLLILWKTYEAKSIVQYNRLITLQHGHSRRVRRMKNGGVWRRLAGSLLGTRQIYLCGAVSPIKLICTIFFLVGVILFVISVVTNYKTYTDSQLLRP